MRSRFVAEMMRTSTTERARATESSDLSFLQSPEQLDLQRRPELANLIEEERATMSGFEKTFLVAIGTTECPLHVPEELRLKQVLRNRTAVDGHEGLVRTVALSMDQARNQLLAGPARTADQNRRRMWRDLSGELQGPHHRRSSCDDLPEGPLRPHLCT